MFKKGDIVRTLPAHKHDEEYWVEVNEVFNAQEFSGVTIKVNKTSDPKNVQVGRLHKEFNTPWFELDQDFIIEFRVNELLKELDKLEACYERRYI